MTIHHDKLAYGKIASAKEELSEDEILKMLEELNDDTEEKKEEENDSARKNK